MAWTGWLATALAASPAEEVDRALHHAAHARAIVSCTPLRAVGGVARTIPLPPALSASEVPRILLDLGEPGAAAAAGLDPEGTVTVVQGDGPGWYALYLPFAGTQEQARALLAK